MQQTQPFRSLAEKFALSTERLGPLPLVNHFISRLGLIELLDHYVPTTDRRCAVPHATALGVLLRSIVVEREPIYRQVETVHGFTPAMYGLAEQDLGHLGDDRLGRALDRLYDAERGALLTAVVLAVGKCFAVKFEELHNDSTSIRFCGQYRVQPETVRGQRPARIAFGYSKDHRPDLKQLLFILTTAEDGGVPVQFRIADGNTNDSITHIETWNTLKSVAGRSDFLYVADSKLCSHENLDTIARAGGRFVTVLPRSRQEDRQFRKRIQSTTPPWELIWDRPDPRGRDGPRDQWYVYRDSIGSMEAWPIVWVWSKLLTGHQRASRQRRIGAAVAYDEKSDGMYPLITNDRTLTPQQVLEAHKGQPRLEKRFEQLKTVHEIAPVFLKNPSRIEAFFTVYFLALLIQALIERELRQTMKRERLKALPLYPEERRCAHPTTEQVLRLFSHAERHLLSRAGRIVQSFEAEFTPLQRQVLDLLGVPASGFRG